MGGQVIDTPTMRIYNEGREEGLAEGKAEGLAEGKHRGIFIGAAAERKKLILTMLNKGKSPESISYFTGIPFNEILDVQKEKE